METGDNRLKYGKRMVRNAAAVFIIIIVLLTFFSKTINNYLLPEVESRSPWNGYLNYEVKASGSVKSSAETQKIIARGSWYVTDVMVKEGDKVSEGDVLAAVDTGLALLDIQKAEFELRRLEGELKTYIDTYKPIDVRSYEDEVRRAEKAVEDQKVNLDIIISLYAESVDATGEASSDMKLRLNQETQRYESLKLDYAAKLRLLDQKRAEAEGQEEIYNRTVEEKQTAIRLKSLDIENMKNLLPPDNRITAPADCVIKSVNIVPGQTCSNQQVIFEYAAGGSKLTIEWMLNAAKAELLEEGDPVEFSIRGRASLSWKGKVGEKEFSSRDGMYLYKAEIPADGDKLVEGMGVEVRASRSRGEYSVIVPRSALSKYQNRDCVFILKQRQGALGEENYVEAVTVSIVDTDDLNAAVNGDLRPQDKVVTLSSKPLSSGMQVKLR
jgi:HlyD family secretion protein